MALPTYENKVLTGDKLVTLVGLIKGELANKVSTGDIADFLTEEDLRAALDNASGNETDNFVDALDMYIQSWIGDSIGIENENSIVIRDEFLEDPEDPNSNTIGHLGEYSAYEIHFNETNSDGLIEATPSRASLSSGGLGATLIDDDDITYGGWYGANGFEYTVSDEAQGEELGSIVGTVSEEGVLDIVGDVTLNGAAIALAEQIPEVPDELADLADDSTHRLVTDAEKTAWSGKQDALVFNTAYNASSNKVATMSDLPDISGKQDALVFNTAYNASSNKVATMADIPSVSAFQTASDVQTAITTALSGITSFSFEIVQALPVSNISQTTIYLVLKSSGPSGNIYTEYAYVKTGTDAQTGDDVYGWEILGDTQADIATLSTAEVQTLWANTPADPGW